jgi:hypothetical protein
VTIFGDAVAEGAQSLLEKAADITKEVGAATGNATVRLGGSIAGVASGVYQASQVLSNTSQRITVTVHILTNLLF